MNIERSNNNIGLYIHIPFCIKKCLYCDFPSYPGHEHLYHAYITALCREITDRGGIFCPEIVDTIYIGGGTPSLLPVELLDSILSCIRQNFTVSENVETSMEINPGTINSNKLKEIHALGVNRLSFGIQTFSDELLYGIGRIHSAAQGIEAVKQAKHIGFNNISLDLMYGLPGQTVIDLAQSLSSAVKLQVNHISVYGLKLEEGTPLFDAHAAGVIVLPDDDAEAAMYDYATDYLPANGYHRYEISNFARKDYKCRHNLKYWRYRPYVGFGAAAHSFYRGQRTGNVVDVGEYIERLNDNCSPVSITEHPGRDQAMAEYIFLSLRTTEGLLLPDFSLEFGADFIKKYQPVITRLSNQGLLAIKKNKIALTPLGMKYGNIVFRSFLPD
ncbi:MAG TPA: radical SAM family heme chaperone HemW [Methylomusa anaerophila]|uniref:Heme chaperone HemW n=1 Tax=Methylomusa anaerophila TaxID=1930071 RepID=A0A348ANX4_9FIRM|nr:radical SAM family heme chaperone HemW [Methylomusa anaerophila]BBB92772.1 oxygen-independent coproporphyrinogen-III oxidase 1 [Methylomusa anaerophila]HML87377.1 radical SAM family heme chaperone HemW [Methylomusa anaerophila]